MIVGVPKEIKVKENRVSMTPGGVAALKKRGPTCDVFLMRLKMSPIL